jgi:BirA family biotin operon repressor/biotin-[acetyl-CoA-carboxylase] ligase
VDLKFSPSDIDRILTSTFIQHIEYCDELASTNTRAKQLAAESPEDDSRMLVLTDRQTAGRGRGANRWWSASGSLTFSILFRPDAILLPASRWPQLSLTVGLAVCDAIESLISHLSPRIKWPNDVFLCGRKVCGILVEAAHGQRGSLIVGVGVNVNNSAAQAPHDLRETIVALADMAAGQIRRVDVLVAILQQLEARLQWLGSDLGTLRDEWCRRCLLTGRTVEVEIQSRRIVGVCRGIDHDGALILDTPARLERCLSGVVIRFA